MQTTLTETSTQPRHTAELVSPSDIPTIYWVWHTHSARLDAPAGTTKELVKRGGVLETLINHFLDTNLSASVHAPGVDVALLAAVRPSLLQRIQSAEQLTFIRSYFSNAQPLVLPDLLPTQLAFGNLALRHAAIDRIANIGIIPNSGVNTLASYSDAPFTLSERGYDFVLVQKSHEQSISMPQIPPGTPMVDFVHPSGKIIPALVASRGLQGLYCDVIKGALSPSGFISEVLEKTRKRNLITTIIAPLEEAVLYDGVNVGYRGQARTMELMHELHLASDKKYLRVTGFNNNSINELRAYTKEHEKTIPQLPLKTVNYVNAEEHLPLYNRVRAVLPESPSLRQRLIASVASSSDYADAERSYSQAQLYRDERDVIGMRARKEDAQILLDEHRILIAAIEADVLPSEVCLSNVHSFANRRAKGISAVLELMLK